MPAHLDWMLLQNVNAGEMGGVAILKPGNTRRWFSTGPAL